MKDFELAWRITDPRRASLPEIVLERIKPLSASRSRELYRLSPLSRPLQYPPDVGDLSIIGEKLLAESGPLEDAEYARWFRDLPIEAMQQVYVCWGIGDGVAAVLDWGAFAENREDLWYPFDWMCVFDDTSDWVVLFGPREVVRFAEKSSEWKATTGSAPDKTPKQPLARA